MNRNTVRKLRIKSQKGGKRKHGILLGSLLIVFLILPNYVFAARDGIISSYSIASMARPYGFRYAGGSMCLNQYTWNYPVSGTNLTGAAWTNNATQWYQLIEIRHGGNIGHGYATWNNQTVSINRRRLPTSYVNVVTTTTNNFGDADIRWACYDFKDMTNIGIDHYLATGALDWSYVSYMNGSNEAAGTGVYLLWKNNIIPSAPYEWIRYHVTQNRDSMGGCGCFYISGTGTWIYNPS